MLFVLKQHNYWPSFGLRNSCQFIADALSTKGIQAKVVEVVDNNCIDREVNKYRPTHVVIEALWVVPEKFNVLMKLHPHVKWAIRIHSNTPFLSGEGIALQWIKDYAERYGNRLTIGVNNRRMLVDLNLALGIQGRVLPNIYYESLWDTPVKREHVRDPKHIHVGCFGAIRPLKNQLEQAMAAMAFANDQGKKLYFHINATRVEQNADPVLKNIISLFNGTRHQLVQQPWVDHDAFMLLCQEMDYGMQVSFSETFNIVSADFVFSEVPFVGSEEIEWLDPDSQAPATDITTIMEYLKKADNRRLIRRNKKALRDYSQHSLEMWQQYLDGQCCPRW